MTRDRRHRPVVAPAQIARRVRDAWRVLLHGLPAEPSRVSTGDEMTITLAEFRYLVECNMAGAGLPYDWAWQATSEELERIRYCLNIANHLRGREWQAIEADVVAGWPPHP